MGRADYYKDGSNNVICDQCGFKYKAGALRQQWDGIWACKRCWDPRHPQEFLRGVPDDQAPDLSRPEAPDTFTETAQNLVPWDERIQANFSASPVLGDAPLSVTFTSTSSGVISGFLWDFGDGNTSTEETPTHEYSEGGTYTVTLTVSNSNTSDTKTRTDYITVSEAPPVDVTLFSFTSTGIPGAPFEVSFLVVGQDTDNAYSVSLQPTSVTFGLTVASVSVFSHVISTSPEGNFEVVSDGTIVSLLQDTVSISSDSYVDLSPLSQQVLLESAPNTITNIIIN